MHFLLQPGETILPQIQRPNEVPMPEEPLPEELLRVPQRGAEVRAGVQMPGVRERGGVEWRWV